MQEYSGTDKQINTVNPLVSVCVVTYNQKHFITQCLDSILTQKTDFPFELILGEDDSKDGTREICINYAEKYPDKIRLFLRKEEDKIWINGTKTGRFNFVENLKVARGKYIALCEGDDYWTDPLKLHKQVETLETNKDIVLTFTNLTIEKDGQLVNNAYTNNSERNSFQVFQKPPVEFDINFLAKGNIIHTPVVLFRNLFNTQPIPSYLYKTPIGDWPLYMFLAKFGRINFIDDITAVYRITEGGIYASSSKLKRLEMTMIVFSFLYSHKIIFK